ncbi:MAG: hypothetical protein NZ899_09915 [Thermoguttaceae bacterium]|nr:hypothetical protein [Thermoguttaceae bacterium]MDW8077554.1 hypothetical protein [Thermoguttaceae bacterium]
MLVIFYGKWAQGLTPDTFVGAEGTGLKLLDQFGRPMYLPPNSASNAFFLWMLRYLLVQHWDLNDVGRPEMLRLLFATPRQWLADGGALRLTAMPPAFGPISLVVQAELGKGQIVGWVEMPREVPERAYLRLRLPQGWQILAATIDEQPVPVDKAGVIDLTGKTGKVSLMVKVAKVQDN